MKKVKSVRIRMYRHGLGDCFLLTINYGSKDKYQLLIDCGVIMGTETPDVVMSKVAQNIKDEVGDHIDTVVITHEHWDHLSGFKQAEKIFDKIDFNEVWVAWTEDPENALAKKLRKTREDRKKALEVSLAKLNADLDTDQSMTLKQKASRKSFFEAIEQVTSFSGGLGVAGSSKTKEAFDYVKDKAKSNLFYCTPGTAPITIKDIEGLRIYVLGPPEDEKLIKKDLSEKEVYHKMFMTELGNSYLSAVVPGTTTDNKYMPFDEYSGISLKAVNSIPLPLQSYNDPENAWRRIDSDWMDFSGQLALAMDSDTNNTSLVLAIELVESGKFLLFPGDAQVGNWLSWHNYKWKVKDKDNKTEEIDIKKIFERTVFYKVGHHGSHNATLNEKGLELMNNSELSVMIPVNKEMAKKKKWNMPFPTLYKRLNEKSLGRVIVADEDLKPNGKRPANISAGEWKKFTTAIDGSNKLFFDFEIEA